MPEIDVNLQKQYDTLKAEAEASARSYVLARLTPDNAILLADQIAADFPLPGEPAPAPVEPAPEPEPDPV